MFNLYKDLFSISVGVSLIPPEFTKYDIKPAFLPAPPSKKNYWSLEYSLFNRILRDLYDAYLIHDCYFSLIDKKKIKNNLRRFWLTTRPDYKNYIGFVPFAPQNGIEDLTFNLTIIGSDVGLTFNYSGDFDADCRIVGIALYWNWTDKTTSCVMSVVKSNYIKIGTIIDGQVKQDIQYLYIIKDGFTFTTPDGVGHVPYRYSSVSWWVVLGDVPGLHSYITLMYPYSSVVYRSVSNDTGGISIYNYNSLLTDAKDLIGKALPSNYTADNLKSLVDKINKRILESSVFSLYSISLLPHVYNTFDISNISFFNSSNTFWGVLTLKKSYNVNTSSFVSLPGYYSPDDRALFTGYTMSAYNSTAICRVNFRLLGSHLFASSFVYNNVTYDNISDNLWLDITLDLSNKGTFMVYNPFSGSHSTATKMPIYTDSRREILYKVAFGLGVYSSFVFPADYTAKNCYTKLKKINSKWVSSTVINENSPIISVPALGSSVTVSIIYDNAADMLTFICNNVMLPDNSTASSVLCSGILGYASNFFLYSKPTLIDLASPAFSFKFNNYGKYKEDVHALFYVYCYNANHESITLGSYSIYTGVDEAGNKHIHAIDTYNNVILATYKV